jgi:hypothetical protein
MAWALHDSTTTWLRTLLSALTLPALAVVSRWLRSGRGLDMLRQQVPGYWSAARLHTCGPRFRRFLWTRPRRREPQESPGRARLEQRARAHPDRPPKVA